MHESQNRKTKFLQNSILLIPVFYKYNTSRNKIQYFILTFFRNISIEKYLTNISQLFTFNQQFISINFQIIMYNYKKTNRMINT